MRYGWLVVLLLMVGPVWASNDDGYAKVFIGTYDMFRDNQDTQYGVEAQFADGLTRYDFKPLVGLMRTREQSHYLYTGVSRTSFFAQSETGLAFTFSFGPGLYFYGDGDDTDLGHIFELRSSGGLLWEFADATRIGLHYSHLSNASITEVNPGSEMVTLTYELPF
ncbi:acyloxyacyl hydrolase [Saccharospirillum mangrovi]|uniref:acyloxyacyl hydrolase n=1 Tax=Saccharospirillum mangrovi TaxID=2161747 RepID=UPI001300B522|nr:acyloxyacyl hydrolase [Saccharospirillum mangrovi]